MSGAYNQYTCNMVWASILQVFYALFTVQCCTVTLRYVMILSSAVMALMVITAHLKIMT